MAATGPSLLASGVHLGAMSEPHWVRPVMSLTSSVAAPIVKRLLDAAKVGGADTTSMLAAAGLAPGDFNHLDARVPVRAVRKLYDEAERQTGDCAFGLHMAELARSQPDPLIALAIASSPTMGDVYGSVTPYVHFLNETVQVRLEVDGDVCTLSHIQNDVATAGRHGIESVLAMLFLVGRQTLGDAFSLLAVCFRHPEPSCSAEHRRFFQAKVAFGQQHDALVFTRALLDAPLPNRNERIRDHVQVMLEDMLQARQLGGVVQRVREDLRAEMQKDATLEGVAGRLGVSPRSLQRQLQSEGASFRKVLDEVRREFSLNLLRRRDLTLVEIASKLGFAEQSAFQRAFRRWVGTTPAEWRRSARNSH